MQSLCQTASESDKKPRAGVFCRKTSDHSANRRPRSQPGPKPRHRFWDAVSHLLRCSVAVVAMPYHSSCDAASHTLGLAAGTIGGPSRITARPAAWPSSGAGLIFRPQTPDLAYPGTDTRPLSRPPA